MPRNTWTKKMSNTQCGFHPGHSTTDQNSTLQQIFEKSWEYAKNFYTCFVDLEKAYDRVPHEKLWGVLREYSAGNRLLLVVKSLYSCSEVCVRVREVNSQPFAVGVGLRQGCVMSLLFSSIVYISGGQTMARGPHPAHQPV